jgi:hypothetical protein
MLSSVIFVLSQLRLTKLKSALRAITTITLRVAILADAGGLTPAAEYH